LIRSCTFFMTVRSSQAIMWLVFVCMLKIGAGRVMLHVTMLRFSKSNS
jgi:hypothetical protein